MKNLLSFVLMLLISLSAMAQGDAFTKGSKVINAGIGLPRYNYTNANFFPPISLSYDQGIMELGPGILGIGGIVGYYGSTYKYGTYKWGWRDILVGGRASYHPNFLVGEKHDVYGVVTLGVDAYSFTSNDPFFPESTSVGLLFGLSVGGRYFFSPKFGVFGELGYSFTYATLGVSLKL